MLVVVVVVCVCEGGVSGDDGEDVVERWYE